MTARPNLPRALAVATVMRSEFWAVQAPGITQTSGQGVHTRGAGVVPWRDRDVDALWESLATAGLIPYDWLADPRRGFDGGDCRCRRGDCGACDAGRRARVTLPSGSVGLELAVALASDASGVLAAEALGRAGAAQVVAENPPTRVVWGTDDGTSWRRKVARGWDATEIGRDILAQGFALWRVTESAIWMLCPTLDVEAL